MPGESRNGALPNQMRNGLDALNHKPKDLGSETTLASKYKEEMQQRRERELMARGNKERVDVVKLHREKKLHEFDARCRGWEERLETEVTKQHRTKEARTLLQVIREKKDEVESLRADWKYHRIQAEEARSSLLQRKKELNQNVECLKSYVEIVEQGLSPEVVHFRALLNAIKHLSLASSTGEIKCSISYAWEPDDGEKATIQAKLMKIQGDLKKAGIELAINTHIMNGDTNAGGYKESKRVLLVSYFIISLYQTTVIN
jgi:hypothetical protein